MRWVKLEPIIQSEVSQKDNIFKKMYTMAPFAVFLPFPLLSPKGVKEKEESNTGHESR